MANKNEWNPKFTEYTEFIVNNPNYAGLYYERATNGKIKWVVMGNSKIGRKRLQWWEEKAKKSNINIKAAGWLKKAANAIHPTGKHVCQICGREMSIFYVYPTKNTLKKINKIAKFYNYREFKYAGKDIYEILDILLSLGAYEEFRKLFNIPSNIPDETKVFKEYVKKKYVEKESKKFSPGVMSNAPDRFDGFHSYGLCCRSVSDKGRHKDNLQKYGEDRRAYENWSDGNWKLASWIMKQINRTGKSADHIGPISCGFVHGNLRPVSKAFNSARNNRMSFEDVKKLRELEKKKGNIVSWSSKYLWDKIKNKVSNEAEAKALSKVMSENLQNILYVLNVISKEGYKEYLLRKLNPQYAFFTYGFKSASQDGINLNNISVKEINRKEHRRNAVRYIRIAFESLDEVANKKNRKNRSIISKESIDQRIKNLFDLLAKEYFIKFSTVNDFIKKIESDIINEKDRSVIIEYFNKYKTKDYEIERAFQQIIEIIGDIEIEKYNKLCKN